MTAIILFVSDILGLLLSVFWHECSSKVYFFSIFVDFLFFVMFPAELCVNAKSDCIEYSPIFAVYDAEFIFQQNLMKMGIAFLLVWIIAFPVIWWLKNYENKCGIDVTIYNILNILFALPFLGVAIINFICSMWTNSRNLNIMVMIGLICNYLCYCNNIDSIHRKIHVVSRSANNKIRNNSYDPL